jgi:4-hydroxybenzoate polyprenyltransferase
VQSGLHSIPQKLGIAKALWVARLLHVGMFAALLAVFILSELYWLGLLGVIITAALLIYQHSIVKANDLSRLNAAFFTTNAFVSVILFVTIAADIFLLK